MNLEALALAVDERIRVPGAERRLGRLYAVREADTDSTSHPVVDPDPDVSNADARSDPGGGAAGPGADDGQDGDDEPPPSCPSSAGLAAVPPVDGFVLELLAEGEARTLPQRVRPPAGVLAIALSSGVWAAPLEEDGRPPSRHPERRRAHLTVVVGPEAGTDAADVSVLRYRDGAPTILRGGVGLVHQRMLRCWSRRSDAPRASSLSGIAA